MLSVDLLPKLPNSHISSFPNFKAPISKIDSLNENTQEEQESPLLTKKTLYSYKSYSSKGESFYCCKFDPEDKMIAAGSSKGSIHVFKIHEYISPVITNTLYRLNPGKEASSAITSLRWKKGQSDNKSYLLSASADGKLAQFDISTGEKVFELLERENRNLCLDYSIDGTYFATGGKDKIIRIYDDDTKKVVHELKNLTWLSSGHMNRIFSIKSHPDNPNLLASAGWDRSLYLWDLRIGRSIGSIYGPTVCGDSIDIKEDKILTGSYRNANQLEIWDFSTKKKIEGIDWEFGYPRENSFVNTCQFSRTNNETIVAGCSRLNEVAFYDRRDQNKDFAKIENGKHAVFSVDFANKSDLFCYSGENDTIKVGKIVNVSP